MESGLISLFRKFIHLITETKVSFIKALLPAAFLIHAVSFAAVPGITPGEFSVDQNGAVNYTVPLNVPPGTAGMHPSLSLNYSSHAGQSLLGLGWSLGGLSQVTRCPATQAQDGFVDGVDFDDNDRFCLDGQRLIAITGVYGADGTEYRTEIDSQIKVISYDTDSSNNGPEQFKVWTKSGQIMEYGFSGDSRVETSHNSDVRLWGVNKISDVAGNYLTFNYHEDTPNGESYPLSIQYTGNDNAGLAPYNAVQFEYEIRQQPITAFMGGGKVQLAKRLSKIKMVVDGVHQWEYRLSYENGLQPKLVSIIECDNQNQCLSPTTLTWQEGQIGFEAEQRAFEYNANDGPSLPEWRDTGGVINLLADINGDGLTDRIGHKNFVTNEEAIWVSRGQKGTSAFAPQEKWFQSSKINQNRPGWSYSGGRYNQLIDLTGDGRLDLAMHYNYAAGQAGLWVAVNNGSGFDTPVLWWNHSANDGPNQPEWRYSGGIYNMLLDMNGDGLPDRVAHKNDQTDEPGMWVALNNGAD